MRSVKRDVRAPMNTLSVGTSGFSLFWRHMWNWLLGRTVSPIEVLLDTHIGTMSIGDILREVHTDLRGRTDGWTS